MKKKLRRIGAVIIILLLNLVSSFLFAQPDLSTDQWRDDLLYLQQKIHVDYESLFLKITEEEFDEKIDILYKKIPNLVDHQIKVAISELLALFGYGHTGLGLYAWRYDPIINFHQLPIHFYWFSDGIYVQGVHKDYKKALGARVIKVGNYKVEKALELIKPVASVENDQHFKAFGLTYLEVPEILHAKGIIEDMSSVQLVLEMKGKQFTMEIRPIISEKFPGNYFLVQNQDNWFNAHTSTHTPMWLKHLDRMYFFEYLPKEKLVYVRQSQILDEPDEKIPSFYEGVFKFIEENDVESMILDLRLNSGGENFKNIPIITGTIKSKINQRGRFYVVIGRRTFSAAQNLVNELEKYTEAIFVGEPTAENVNFFGDTKVEILPNSKLTIRLSYIWWQNTNVAPGISGRREWTAPDISVELSSEDYSNGRDPVMEAILNYSPQTPLINLMEDAVFNDRIVEAFRIYDDFKNNKINKYKSTEGIINSLGYQLMGQKKYENAIKVFELNTRDYPLSSNTWDSLAEGYFNTGNMDLAIKYYKKSLKLNPKNRNAVEMLKKLN